MSIMSYQNRGPWGNSSWRGNTSGHIIRMLLDFFQPELFVDPAEGSGTSRDVARDMKVKYVGLDLHSGFNLLRDRLIDRLPRQADHIFFHPPYHDMVVYSGNQWGTPHQDDLSRCGSIEEFIEKLQLATMNIYDAVRPGGNYSILIGDQRKQGEYHSFQADVIKFGLGKLKSVLIKAQHNCVSDKTDYKGGRFIPITHEYLMIFEKEKVLQSFLKYSLDFSTRTYKSAIATWRNLVRWAMMKLGGIVTLDSLYNEIKQAATEKIKENAHWQAKVRQVLQTSPEFINVDRGVWQMVA